MAIRVAEVMTGADDLICVRADCPVSQAAALMARSDVGAVLVMHGEQVVGMCTDRDITVRVTANRSPDTTVKQACGDRRVVTIAADAPITEAAALMAEHAVRRLPVMRDEELVGIVSLADLARDRNVGPTLSAISSAPPNP
jgi:CBS domain-containing protein